MLICLFSNLVRFFYTVPASVNPTLAIAARCAAQHWAHCASASASPFASPSAGFSTEPPGSHGRCRMPGSGEEKSGMSPLPAPVPVALCVCVLFTPACFCLPLAVPACLFLHHRPLLRHDQQDLRRSRSPVSGAPRAGEPLRYLSSASVCACSCVCLPLHAPDRPGHLCRASPPLSAPSPQASSSSTAQSTSPSPSARAGARGAPGPRALALQPSGTSPLPLPSVCVNQVVPVSVHQV